MNDHSTHNEVSFNYSFDYYFLLLKRYARRWLLDSNMASITTLQVLREDSQKEGLHLSKEALKGVKTNLYNLCIFYNNAQIFDRPVIKLSSLDKSNDENSSITSGYV